MPGLSILPDATPGVALDHGVALRHAGFCYDLGGYVVTDGAVSAEDIEHLALRILANQNPDAIPLSEPGLVVWLTGLSGAGKSTTAALLAKYFSSHDLPMVLLDGDVLRDLMSAQDGHGRDRRLGLAHAYSRLCQVLSTRGFHVVCATMSLFHEVQGRNRREIPRYVEIYLRVPLDELRRRDPKGLYAKAEAGMVTDVVGIDLPAEEPRNPDLVLDHAETRTADDIAAHIWSFLGAQHLHTDKTAPVLSLGTKAETLASLAGRVSTARVLPLCYFSVAEWQADSTAIEAHLAGLDWAKGRLILRSSALGEDTPGASLAGRFASVAGVTLGTSFRAAVETVKISFGAATDQDQILVQPMLDAVVASGVAFSRDPTTRAPYFVVNLSEGADTTAVTGGQGGGELRTFVHWRDAAPPADPRLAAVLALMRELEQTFAHECLDVEFAFAADQRLYLFQVRPLVMGPAKLMEVEAHGAVLRSVAERVAQGIRPDPFIHGRRSVYGVMPDWNPAEIIGIRPRPLALSLYRDLVTDAIWAYQRHNYGYKNLRSCPLLVHFHGLPYIDVRVSFNSFIPADIDDDLADRLVNYYIDRLVAAPQLHDKVEFEIIFSCYTPSLPVRAEVLRQHGFRAADVEQLVQSLRGLTNNIIHHKRGLWHGDLEKLAILERRRKQLMAAETDTVGRIYWLMEDCKRYGSLPFAGLARAGFIAVQLLHSLVEIGVLCSTDYHRFMTDLNTVSSQMGRDRASFDRATFLGRYGHLRPGTYDILSPRYDEAPDLYFDWTAQVPPREAHQPFVLSLDQMREIGNLLRQHGLESDVVAFFDFIKAGIEGREYAKFVFTRNLSDAISLFRHWGEQLGFSADDLSYADISIIRELYASSADPWAMIAASIAQGRARYEITRQIMLPPLIRGAEDVWSFELPACEPNFITLNRALGPVVPVSRRDLLQGAIVAIPNADPGFDWLFSFPIAGLVTAYGGVNSHMAIRAGELGLPAVIGAGERLFKAWSEAEILSIDCGNRQVTVIR